MKFSRQEKVTFRYRLLLNRGGHMDNFDCILSNEENQNIQNGWKHKNQNMFRIIFSGKKC
jgi:hypothetical protein